ncbi:MAG: hypothetical protein SFX72_06525 [Isosphaeraceae bacterium]|nr:hypothetical protein [Isosphaeraceae bacterium]
MTSNTAFDLRSGTASAILGGSAGIVKTTTGVVTLAGVNTYTGTTTITQGILQVDGSINGPVVVASPGTLAGSGSIFGAVSGTGTARPGPLGAGILTIQGNLTSIGSLAFEIRPQGLEPTATRLVVNGTANLAGTSTQITSTPGGIPAGANLVLLQNDLADALTINGATSPTPGSTVTLGATPFVVGYSGGTGNDLVITANPTPAATLTIVSGNAQSTVIGSPFAAPLVVQARDALGSHVVDADVIFVAPAAGASRTVTGGTTTRPRRVSPRT